MTEIVKRLRAGLHLFDRLAHAFVGREKNGPKHSLLRFDRVRRQTVNFGRIDKRRLFAAAALEVYAAVCGIRQDGIDHSSSSNVSLLIRTTGGRCREGKKRANQEQTTNEGSKQP